ncbi:MAG: ABC transporter permease subunit [Gammaproteobacteria bacterium]|nr:ABC transporter permease subunit [Gammaproteobacteria bacterium]
MDDLATATHKAFVLLFSGDSDLWQIIGISFNVSTNAILIALVPALSLAFALSYLRFPGRRFLIAIFNTLLSMPAVVIGLIFYLFLSRHGPLGDLRLLFTQSAMIIGQIALCFPILVAMGHAAFQASDKRAWETARTLGASPFRALYTVMHEVRFGLLATLLAAYGRIIAEVGTSMMLGGNIYHYTRNIPTAIALETSKGEYAQGIALGTVLILMTFILNTTLHYFQGRGQVVA